MFKALPSAVTQLLSRIADNQLALMAAVLLEVSIRHFSYHSQNYADFLTTWLQLLFESSPLLLAHYFAFKTRSWLSVFVWGMGFILYPCMNLWLMDSYQPYVDWAFFGVQGWIFLCIASIGYSLSCLLAKRHNTKSMLLMSRLFSLNAVLLMLLVGWSVLWAGIFASTDDPIHNQPIKAVINSETVIVNFGDFLNYWWQFLLMGVAVLLIYGVNRYLLIRRVLANSGVFAYVASCLICIIVMTPILASAVLWLPMNIPEWTFLPSEDYKIFAPVNFRFSFFVIAISTPIILAFERQQHEKALAEIAQRQSQTELQLLQQQVNPHFLFNTLNNLYALTLTGSKAAPDLVMQLANLLRYTVYEGQNQRVTLAQEIDYLQDFLALQAIRSGEKCTVHTAFPLDAEHWKIAPLLLIIIVENAFKHGVEPSQTHCHISLDMQVKNGQLLMQCNNSLPNKRPQLSPGIGLENLRRRLALLYPGKHNLNAMQRGEQWQSSLSVELEPC
ncbi:sensor histidine kinase [Paraglaciecola hydrolytica]|uniref:Signal transduction histidine kinase internal region domain-containing protein n=1 Tax=Paraglaciecola hydrolytica TaxID=1799789 RepID=A0A135ZZ87_9ALTE|nr:histidine kinase [Paraglaciecola hydrolytica]KXI28293.1 hypothetical protein AX660_18145 [Paraglaciecola hydrolytica]